LLGVVGEVTTVGLLLLKTCVGELQHGNTTLPCPWCGCVAAVADKSAEDGGDTNRHEPKSPFGRCLAEGAALAMSATDDRSPEVEVDTAFGMLSSGPPQMLLMLQSASFFMVGTVRVKSAYFSGLFGPGITRTQVTTLAPAASASLLACGLPVLGNTQLPACSPTISTTWPGASDK